MLRCFTNFSVGFIMRLSVLVATLRRHPLHSFVPLLVRFDK
jgi:hypothetical protein